MDGRERGVTSTVGTVLMVATALLAAALVGVVVFDLDPRQEPAPQVVLSHELVDDGGEQSVAVTMESGDAVRVDRLYVVGSVDLDVGGPPDAAGNRGADERFASERERFDESSGGRPPQAGTGETWDAGETVYLDPVGSADGVTVTIYWSSDPIAGVNPGTVTGEDTYEIASFTV
jgi:FlaG/FlaF family flagellin (archaellin)